MRKKCSTCICRTCLRVCKCESCKEKVESCKRYSGFSQLSIFETSPEPKIQSVPRHSLAYYKISKERYEQLADYIRSGRYAAVARHTAYRANKDIAEYILLSVVQNKSYDAFRVKWELKEMEQIPYCRTDFYGIRRYFYSLFDKELRRIGK